MKVNDLKDLHKIDRVKAGQFEGKFLLAMPNIGSAVFDRSVIYLCAHSKDGAMGFCINKINEMTIEDLVTRSDAGKQNEIIISDRSIADCFVGDGGPVDTHRGFVLHSDDYQSDATIAISSQVHLTSNIQILRSIVDGKGPTKSAVSLGYSGWGPGQLEQEIKDNAWLTLDADPDIIFSTYHASKYEQLLGALGINLANFVTQSGRA